MTNLSGSGEEAIDGEDPVGSYRHSSIQTNIAYLLKLNKSKKIHVLTELSLDISQFDLSKYKLNAKNEIEPDVAGYFVAPTIPEDEDDLLRVTQMPDLAIEISSPRQDLSYIQRKIRALFAIGVQSCWMVVPTMRTILVYSAPKKFKNFDLGDEEVIDEKLGINIPIKEIFEL